MDTGLRFAAIDIGSNAIRLLFARIIENGNDKPFLVKESLIRMPLRLGQDVFIDGEISAINSEKFLKTLSKLLENGILSSGDIKREVSTNFKDYIGNANDWDLIVKDAFEGERGKNFIGTYKKVLEAQEFLG